jgi:tRNA-binding EMAP/Myf-like protein
LPHWKEQRRAKDVSFTGTNPFNPSKILRIRGYLCPLLKSERSMTISYNWLSDYLPVKIEPERLSHILTSVGLEVEKMEAFEEVKGGLKGLLLGEVLDVQQHPNADKLKLTKVTVGGEPLPIVCGAPNVAPSFTQPAANR